MDRPHWPRKESIQAPDPSSMPWSAYDLDEAFFSACGTLATGSKAGRLVSSETPDLPFNVISQGMSGLNLKSRDPRPSSSLATLMAAHARAGLAEVTPDQILPFLRRETVASVAMVAPKDRTRFVLVRCGPLNLGLGHVNRQGKVESLFPSHLAGLPVKTWLTGLEATGA